MHQVEIYLFTSAVKKGEGSYSYRLECRKMNHITKGDGILGGTDARRLALTCAIEALDHMLHPANITIYTDNQSLVNLHRYLAAWAGNDWKKADGKQPKNLDLWQQLHEREQGHRTQYRYEQDMKKFRKEN